MTEPTHAGRWLASTENWDYEAEVREIVPGVFEALIHGYAWDWHPLSTFYNHFERWVPLKEVSRSR